MRRAFEAVAAVLRGLAALRPTLLLLDDLHNAGLATVEFLHFLARHSGRSRLLVLATLRPEEGGDALAALADVADRLEVGPLPADAVRRLAHDAGRAEQAADILRRTRGHTLFVVATLQAMLAGEPGVPESLQAVVLARIGRLGSAIEDVLRAGAVLGAAVDPAVVAAMLGVPPYAVAQRCEQAVAGRLLVAAGRQYEFANDLIHEVLYATTPAPVRTAYHLAAADRSTRRPEAVARHAAAAADWPRAARVPAGRGAGAGALRCPPTPRRCSGWPWAPPSRPARPSCCVAASWPGAAPGRSWAPSAARWRTTDRDW